MKKIALIFPGQGAQAVGMGQDFYNNSQAAKEIFDKADQVIDGLSDVIFNGPAEKLTSTAYCQPAIFTFSVAVLEALRASDINAQIDPQFACGLSLGELSAVYAAGVLSFEDALKVVERRAHYMEEATQLAKGAMSAVIGFEEAKIAQICDQTGAQVANFNSPDQIVITGEAQKVEVAATLIAEQGAKRVIPLDVSGAFHSSLMEPAVPKFKEELAQFEFQTPNFPIISNVNGLPESDPEKVKSNLSHQITSSVQWVKTVQTIATAGVDTFLELGPGTVLKGLIRKIDRELTVYSIQKPEDIANIAL